MLFYEVVIENRTEKAPDFVLVCNPLISCVDIVA